MLRPSSSASVHDSATYRSTLMELRKAEDDEAALQRHLQRMKDPKGLETLFHVREKIKVLTDRLRACKDDSA